MVGVHVNPAYRNVWKMYQWITDGIPLYRFLSITWVPPSSPFVHLLLKLGVGAVAFQDESGEGGQDHLGTVAFQVEAGKGSQDRLGAVAFQVEAGKGSQGRQLHRCSPLQPSLVVLDEMRTSGLLTSRLHRV